MMDRSRSCTAFGWSVPGGVSRVRVPVGTYGRRRKREDKKKKKAEEEKVKTRRKKRRRRSRRLCLS